MLYSLLEDTLRKEQVMKYEVDFFIPNRYVIISLDKRGYQIIVTNVVCDSHVTFTFPDMDSLVKFLTRNLYKKDPSKETFLRRIVFDDGVVSSEALAQILVFLEKEK
jgi:hypothetical protein